MNVWGNTLKLFIILVNSNNKTVKNCNLYPSTKIGLSFFCLEMDENI